MVMQAKLQPTSRMKTKTVDIRIGNMKTIHVRWTVKAFDMVTKDTASTTHGWKLAGLLYG